MFKAIKTKTNTYSCNELILKGMLKRRRLACAAILNICDSQRLIKVVK